MFLSNFSKTTAMKKMIIFLSLIAGFLIFTVQSFAQTEEELLAQLLDQERSSVDALVLYPENTRISILEATLYPEALVKLESMQTKTSQAFQNLMENYPNEVREKAWDMTRYPNLISRLVEAGQSSSGSLEQVLGDYPDEVKNSAKEIYSQHFPLLVTIDQMDLEWNRAFDGLMQDYPLLTQNALRDLVQLPEVLSILTDNIRMAVLVGDIYRRKPDWLLSQMDSLSLIAARDRARELEDWKNNLESNPQAKEELMQSAQAFADEYSYDDSAYDYDDAYYSYNSSPQQVVTQRYYYYNYPYWYGYPSWYSYPRWRPYPVWWDWGFYYGPGRVIVIVDLPSYYFTHWYFYRPYHHYYYPYFSSYMVNHYYGHRGSGSSVIVAVNQWQRHYNTIVTDGWLRSSTTKPENFREFGKMEGEREKYNASHPTKAMDSREYLDKNRKKYPELAKEVAVQKQKEAELRQPDRVPIPQPQADEKRRQETLPPARTEPPTSRQPDTEVPPVRQPDVVQPPRAKEPVQPTPPRQQPQPPVRQPTPVQPAPTPKQQPQAPAPRQNTAPMPNLDKASDFHKNTWERTSIELRRVEPAPRVTTPPATRPAAPAPKAPTPPARRGS